MKGHRPDVAAVTDPLASVPPLPDTLPAEMANDWSEVVADLVARKLLSRSMMTVLETYIGAVWMARQCRRAIAEHGPVVRSKDGALRPNPASGSLAKAADTVARLAYEMGLSPAGRNLPSIKSQSGAANDSADPLAEFDI